MALAAPTIPSLGYALQTGANQLTTLPWANINTICVQFSGPVSNIGLGSLSWSVEPDREPSRLLR